MERTIIITESQRDRLFEAANAEFSYAGLMQARDKYEYCLHTCGEPYMSGSSRVVFDLDDEKVIKVAQLNPDSEYYGGVRDGVGEAQNKQECEIYLKSKSPIIPKVFGFSKDYSYMIAERVVPATEEDFEKLLGISFDRKFLQNTSPYADDYEESSPVIGYDKYFDNLKKPFETNTGKSFHDLAYYVEHVYIDGTGKKEEDAEEIINGNEWLKAWKDFAVENKLSDIDALDNYGMVNRDGSPMLVLLDYGLTYDLWDEFYG